jgi:hypothetical protein
MSLQARITTVLAGAILALGLVVPALAETAPIVRAAQPVAAAAIAKPVAAATLPKDVAKVGTGTAAGAPKVDDGIGGGHTTAREQAEFIPAAKEEEKKESPLDKLPPRPGEDKETTPLSELDPMEKLKDLIVTTPEEFKEENPAWADDKGLVSEAPTDFRVTVDESDGKNDVSRQDQLSETEPSSDSPNEDLTKGNKGSQGSTDGGSSSTESSSSSAAPVGEPRVTQKEDGSVLETVLYSSGASVTTKYSADLNREWVYAKAPDGSWEIRFYDSKGRETWFNYGKKSSGNRTPVPDGVAGEEPGIDPDEAAAERRRQVSLGNDERRHLEFVNIDPNELLTAIRSSQDEVIDPADEGANGTPVGESGKPSLGDYHRNGDPTDGTDDPANPGPNE